MDPKKRLGLLPQRGNIDNQDTRPITCQTTLNLSDNLKIRLTDYKICVKKKELGSVNFYSDKTV